MLSSADWTPPLPQSFLLHLATAISLRKCLPLLLTHSALPETLLYSQLIEEEEYFLPPLIWGGNATQEEKLR